MGVEAGAAVRRGPAFSLWSDARLKLDQSLGLGLEVKVELGMGLKPLAGLKLEAGSRRSGSP